MEDNPDYTQYNLTELYDVYRHIDREHYPERFTAISQEIAARENRYRTEVEAAAAINLELLPQDRDSVEPPPDYTKCDLQELYDIQRRIYRDLYPEAFAALSLEIARRENHKRTEVEAAAAINLELLPQDRDSVEPPPDCTKFSLHELYDAYRRIDRDRYPEHFAAISREIAARENHKRAEVEAAAVMNPELLEEYEREHAGREKQAAAVMAVRFHGSAREYFSIWIVNLCLTLVTFGIFSAWAKVRRKRYFYSHTTLDGTPFQYLGRPIPILKGRLIAAAAFVTYYLSMHLFTGALPFVVIAGIVLAPWIVVRSAAFNARYSAYRNMVFHYDGTYLDAIKALYTWAIILIVVAVVGTVLSSGLGSFIAAVAIMLAGILFPWWIRRFKNLIIAHTSYGGINGVFSATGGQFWSIYFVAVLIVGSIGAVTAAIAAGLLGVASASESDFSLLALPVMASMYFGYALSYAYIQSRSGNLVWNGTRLGPLRFTSTLKARNLVLLYVTNALAIAASAGLLIPWAVVRTLKYRAEHLTAIPEGHLAEFKGSDKTSVQAAAAEISDFFDVDLSL